jgi:hypothetical protein
LFPTPPPPPVGAEEAGSRSVRGLLEGPRRLAPRPRARRGALVLRHHSHRVCRHHNHHHHRARRRQQHLGMIFPRGTNNTSSNNNSSSNSSSRSSGHPASRVAGRSRVPSECNPFFPINLLIMSTGLNPSFACQGLLPLCSQGRASPAPGCCRQDSSTGPPGPCWGFGSSGANAKRCRSGGGVPIAPAAATTSTTAMPSSTPSAAAEEALAAPAPAIVVDAGGASSFVPSPTPEETDVIFGRWLQSGAEPEVAPIPLPRVLSRAHQALHEIEAVILREWEALEAEHQRLDDWRTQLEERTKAASRQFAFERSELERDRKDYKKDL